MYLKEICLYNYRSYSGRHALEDLSQGLTVFMGVNGSGKSNFLKAMNFVICDKEYHAKFYNKYHLLKSDRGCMHIVVEMTFADCKPVFNGNFTIRHMINANTDKYYFNDELVLKNLVKDLLKVSGFCTEPYLFPITGNFLGNLISMSPDKRLNFILKFISTNMLDCFGELKSILGAINILNDSIMEIQDSLVLADTSERQVKEWEKLKKLMQLKHSKVCIVVRLLNQQISKWRLKKQSLESQLSENSKLLQRENLSKKLELNQCLALVDQTKCLIAESNVAIEANQSLLDDSVKERNCLLKENEKLELALKDLHGNIRILKDSLSESGDQNLIQLKNDLVIKKEQLERESIKLDAIKKEIRSEEQKRFNLLSLGSNFPDKKSRDIWLRKNILQTSNEIIKTESTLKDLLLQITAQRKLKSDMESKIENLNKQHESLVALNEQQSELKCLNNRLHVELSEVRRKENDVEQEVQLLKKTIELRGTQLQMKVGKSVANGIKSIWQVVDSWKGGNHCKDLASGYLGTVLDNFTCDKDLNNITEIAGKNFLLFHIVTSDIVGTEILKKMTDLKLPGGASFLPLNRIRAQERDLVIEENAVPLIKKLSFETHVEKAIKFCFGNVLICSSLEVAVELARKRNCHCLTTDGDEIRRNGVLSGGHHNLKGTIREVYSDIRKSEGILHEKNKMLEELKSDADSLQQKIVIVTSNLEKIRTEIDKSKSVGSINLSKIAQIENDLEKLKILKQKYQEQIKELNLKYQFYETELDTSFTSDQPESEKICETNKKIIDLTKTFNKQEIVVLSCIDETEKVQNIIKNVEERLLRVEQIHNEMKRLEVKRKGLEENKSILEERLEVLRQRIVTAENVVCTETLLNDERKTELCKLTQDVKRFTPTSVSDAVAEEKIKIYDQKILESISSIANIKSNYNDVSLYENLPKIELHRLLAEVNQGIKKLGKVDHKLLKTKNPKLNKLRNDLDFMFQTLCYFIEQTIKTQDWLRFTFKKLFDKVAERFQHFLSCLLPNCTGELVIDEDIDFFKGAILNISFWHRTSLSPFGLSGGQKNLTALSLLFACMEISNVKFCAMDEIDQALGVDSVNSLTQVIKELGEKGLQFISSSHNREFISSATKLYYMTFRESSQVREITSFDEREHLISVCQKDSICSSDQSQSNSS